MNFVAVQKRGREDVQIGGGGNDDNGSGAEFHKRTSTEDGPTEVEREASPDDFEDSRPKRSRTTGGTSSEPALSLIGKVMFTFPMRNYSLQTRLI